MFGTPPRSVPHQCPNLHWMPPVDLSVLLAAWQTGAYDILNELQQVLDELIRDLGSTKWGKKAILYPAFSGSSNTRLSQK